MSDLHPLVYLPALVGVALSSFRWLRVCQREHYLAGSVARFAWRWWWLHNLNRLLLAAAIAAVVVTAFVNWLVVVAVLLALVGPLGLSHRGHTSKLTWTRRLITVAIATAVLVAVVLAITAMTGGDSNASALALAIVAIVLPGLIDLALLITKPIERTLTRRWVKKARTKLDRIDPTRVAITGSFGKTTVKGYLRHLVSGTHSVVASPGSFNNTAGLCRTINEHLERGTEVLIAEMGTYGRGEIAAMVRWVQPSVSVLTSVGPVHLERFGSLESIVAAKTEVFGTSRTAILNVDAPLLEAEAVRLEASGIRVIRCSAVAPGGDAAGTGSTSGDPPPAADVCVYRTDKSHHKVVLFGRPIDAAVSSAASPTNVACAIAAASVLGVSDEDIAQRLPTLPVPSNRREMSVSASGVTVIDDTYNSNPAGAAAALEMLANADVNRRVVVTPGMVEMGSAQAKQNAEFARAAAEGVANDFVIVGLTNKAALIDGAHSGTAVVRTMKDREAAVQWVRANLKPGDGVLYENDLPDHFP